MHRVQKGFQRLGKPKEAHQDTYRTKTIQVGLPGTGHWTLGDWVLVPGTGRLGIGTGHRVPDIGKLGTGTEHLAMDTRRLRIGTVVPVAIHIGDILKLYFWWFVATSAYCPAKKLTP